MPASGYGAEACLAFDEYCVEWVKRFRAMAEERVEVDAPPREKRAKPKVWRPAHDEAALLAVLGIDPEEEGASDLLAAAVADFDWSALDDLGDLDETAE